MAKDISIVRSSNIVTVDGESHWVDCSTLPAYVKVIQWYTDRGHIEFVNDPRGAFLPNVNFSDLNPYQHLVDAWSEAKLAAEAKTKADAAAKTEGAQALAALRKK